MPTITPSIVAANTYKDDVHYITWANLLNTDDGAPIEMPGSNDRSIQFVGTFGTGGTIVLEGSNNGTHWRTLNDPNGNPISKTAADIEAILELTRFVRPRVIGGDGTTNLSAIMVVRRP